MRRHLARAAIAAAVAAPALAQPAQAHEVRRVSATAYCHATPTANGQRPRYRETAAMNGAPMGSRWRLDVQGHGAYRDTWHDVVLRVNDTGSSQMQFDLAMPGRCSEARRKWGRATILIERVG